MAKASILLPVLLALCAALVVNSASSQNAPAPSVDCTSLVLNLADCLPFVTNGSKDTKPQGSCCTGLKTVLKTDAECLCETFKKSSSFGVVLNVSKALTLPASCGVSAPSVSKCGLSLAAGNSPAHSPMAAPTPMSPTSPSLSPSGEPVSDASTTPAPAPSPGSSGAAGVQISIALLLVSLVVVESCSYFRA